MTQSMAKLMSAVQPLMTGLTVAGLLIASLVVLRLLLRGSELAAKLRIPRVLATFYLLLAALCVLSRLYWPRAFDALSLLSLFVLALAAILAIAVAVFDLFLARSRRINVPTILRDITVVVIYVATIFVVLSQYGVNLSSILTTSAVLTAIIGFALQDLLSNVISGIALQIERPFKVGDWLMLREFGEQQGRVLEMNWRSVKILTLHQDVVVAPNTVLTGSAVINFSEPSSAHRRRIRIGLRYEAPPNTVKRSLLRAARHVSGVVPSPAPRVLIDGYEDFAITYRLNFFIEDFERREAIEDAVKTRIWYQLKRDGLSVPFPIRDINLRKIEADGEAQRRAQQIDEVVSALGKVAFLEPLPATDRRTIAARIEHRTYAAGEEVLRAGDPGSSFFIVAEGEVEVRSAGRSVARLGGGEFFGEMSLLTGEPRRATVVCLQDASFYVISKAIFQEVIASNEKLLKKIAEKIEARRDALAASEPAESDQSTEGEAEVQSLVGRIRRFFSLE